jgi:D-lactate dehydrogenase
MKLAVYSAQAYDREYLNQANALFGHQLHYIDEPLNAQNTQHAKGCRAVSIFVNDKADYAVIEKLAQQGVGLLALRCTGFNHVDVSAAKQFGISVVRVSEYPPNAVAEHAALLLLALNRKLLEAHTRVQNNNFSLNGLMGFDLHGKTIGIIGAGKIGEAFCKIAKGFGCHVIAFDIIHNRSFIEAGGHFVSLAELAKQADVITLHCALTPETTHLIDQHFILQCKKGVLLINTSRGAVIDTHSLLPVLRNKHLGGLAMDVYEYEAGLFFKDHSSAAITDELLKQLQAMSNVIITGHQGFLTIEAFSRICQTTLESVRAFENGGELVNAITL